ncbi:Uncharacterised protein [Flavonifractor plautii]|nr:Uncharacterised protein [Flavonifractor plautii]
MTASVPEFTMRTISMLGTMPIISSAISTSRRVGAPKERPSFTARSTASRITGWLWPRIMGPQEQM